MNPIRIFSAGYIICCCWIHSWFSHDVTKIQTTKLSILPRFYFHDVSEQLKINFHTNFRFKRVLGFVIEYAWISKHAFVPKLGNRCFCWFSSAMLLPIQVGTSMASPPLYIWVQISRIRNILLTWILARIFVYLPSFISQIPDLVYWTVLIFILIYFEWRDTQNQQYLLGVENNLGHTHKTRLAGTF